MGCGEGFIVLFLLEKYPNLCIEGCDINHKVINFAKKFIPNVKFDVLDIKECHILKNNRYDLILATEALEHPHYYEQALNKLAKLDFSEIIISAPN